MVADNKGRGYDKEKLLTKRYTHELQQQYTLNFKIISGRDTGGGLGGFDTDEFCCPT